MKKIITIIAGTILAVAPLIANAQCISCHGHAMTEQQYDHYRAQARQMLNDKGVSYIWRYHDGSERIAFFGQKVTPLEVCELVNSVEYVSVSHVWSVETGEIAVCETGETNIDPEKIIKSDVGI